MFFKTPFYETVDCRTGARLWRFVRPMLTVVLRHKCIGLRRGDVWLDVFNRGASLNPFSQSLNLRLRWPSHKEF